MKPLTDAEFRLLLACDRNVFGTTWNDESGPLVRRRLLQFAGGVLETLVITPMGREALVYEQQRRNEPPFRVDAHHPSLTADDIKAKLPPPNDVCAACEEPIHMPEHAVRCEYDSCVFDCSEGGEAMDMGWSEVLDEAFLYGDDERKRVYFRPPTHMCETCFGKPHSETLATLVSRGRKQLHVRRRKKKRTRAD